MAATAPREFEMRLNGASYEEVARAGGGIVSTVTATRAASEAELLAGALARVDALIAEGVCDGRDQVGLRAGHRHRTADAARRPRRRPRRARCGCAPASSAPMPCRPNTRAARTPISTRSAFPRLRAAHAEGLVDAVDGFCEGIAFSPAQIARVFDVARELGLPVKLHAEQLSNLGGAQLAARYGALSADHLEYIDEPTASPPWPTPAPSR